MALYVYILISLVMLYGGVHLLVAVFTKVKDTLFKMFLGAMSIVLIAGAIGVFLVGVLGA
jgi:hypothetical protein